MKNRVYLEKLTQKTQKQRVLEQILAFLFSLASSAQSQARVTNLERAWKLGKTSIIMHTCFSHSSVVDDIFNTRLSTTPASGKYTLPFCSDLLGNYFFSGRGHLFQLPLIVITSEPHTKLFFTTQVSAK